LFGSKADQALQTLKTEMLKARRGEESELINLLISRRWLEQMGPFNRDPLEVELVQLKV
jgi:hypothetical protein